MWEGSHWVVRRDGFVAEFVCLQEDELESVDNIDVYVTLPDGTRRYATILTLQAIEACMNRHAESGEDSGNLFWSTDLVISRFPGVAAMTDVIAELVASGNIDSACTDYRSADDA